MTDKPHTPTTRGVRSAYIRVWNGQIQGANAETVAAEFDRWLATIEDAAEQRGKEQAWDEGYQDGYNDGLSDGHSINHQTHDCPYLEEEDE